MHNQSTLNLGLFEPEFDTDFSELTPVVVDSENRMWLAQQPFAKREIPDEENPN
jgi:hypothetical protein